MDDKKPFIKVRVWRILRQGNKISINEDATFNPIDEFSNKIYDSDENLGLLLLHLSMML